MKKISFLIFIFIFQFSFSQYKFEFGASFDYDVKAETKPEFVLTDNYNTYLLSTVNVTGMMSKNEMIVRKFDQKNQLITAYKQSFPKFDIGTLHNVLGTTATNTGKAAVFTESYSSKSKKTDISKLVFDKKTNVITTEVLATYPILSAGKAATVSLQKSDNGNYIAIRCTKNRAKEEPEISLLLILDANSLEVVWQKEVSFDDKYFTEFHAVSNSEKVVLVRSAKSWKLDNYLTIVTLEGQENKTFEEPVKLQEPKLVSIGTQDYLIAFNYPIKGARAGDYDKLLFYDITLGKTLQNNKISEFANLKRLVNVEIKNVFLQNNEIHLFTQAKTQMDDKNSDGSVNSQAFFNPKFKYELANVFIMSYEGILKSIIKLPTDTTREVVVSDSFGLIKLKGIYYLNTGHHYSFFALNSDFSRNANNVISFSNYEDPDRERTTYINQLINFLPDSNRYIFARTIGLDKMSLVNVFNVK